MYMRPFQIQSVSVIYKEGMSQENALTLKAAKVIDAMIFHLTKVTPQNLNYLPSLPLCWDLFEEVSKVPAERLVVTLTGRTLTIGVTSILRAKHIDTLREKLKTCKKTCWDILSICCTRQQPDQSRSIYVSNMLYDRHTTAKGILLEQDCHSLSHLVWIPTCLRRRHRLQCLNPLTLNESNIIKVLLTSTTI